LIRLDARRLGAFTLNHWQVKAYDTHFASGMCKEGIKIFLWHSDRRSSCRLESP